MCRIHLSRWSPLRHPTAIALVAVSILTGSITVGQPSTSMAVGPSSALSPVQPCRLVDTRRGGSLPAGDVMTVVAAGRCGIPDDATAVALQVTVARTIGRGHVTVVPAGTRHLITSTVNWYRDGQSVTAGAVIAVGDGGAVDLHLSGVAHVIVDVSAGFTAASTSRSGRFIAHGPVRTRDTRLPGETPWAPGEVRRVALPVRVPADTVAMIVNVTAIDSPARGHFTAYVPVAARPVASILNTDAAGQTRASTAIVPVDADGFLLYSSAGGNVAVDVFGYFTGESAAERSDGLFRALGPARVSDTRSGSVLFDGGSQHVETTAETGPVAAVVGTVTLARTSAATHLTAFPARTALPATSNVNADAAGQVVANLFVVASSSSGLYLRAERETDVIVDVTGAFTGRPVPPSVVPYPLSNVDPGPDCHGTTGRTALVDRIAQRLWLCDAGRPVTGEMPFTAGPINDAPQGEYQVFFKRDPWWGAGYTLRWFTAFTRGDHGGRVAFHRYVAMREDDVGTEAYRNASHGCFRLRTADALTVWNFLGWGDRVIVLNNG